MFPVQTKPALSSRQSSHHSNRLSELSSAGPAMAFTFAAFTYISALIIDAFLLFFSIFHVSNKFNFVNLLKYR